MPQVVYTIGALLGFGFIIFIHELGHFLAAKLFGVKVRAFSIGYPPTVLRRQMGETEYRFGIIPLGGYVLMLGEEGKEQEEVADDPRALPNIKAWKRSIIFLAGVGLNIVSAIVIYMVASVVGIEVTAPVVGGLVDPSPAKTAGLVPGQRIVSIDGQKVDSFSDIRMLVTIGGLDDPRHKFKVEIEGLDRPVEMASTRSPGDPVPTLGVAMPVVPVIGEVKKDSPAEKAGFKKNDRIVAVDGKSVEFLAPCLELLLPLKGKPAVVTVDRARKAGDGEASEGRTERIDLAIDPVVVTVADYGLEPLIQIRDIVDDSAAAKAGLLKGDYLLAIGDHRFPESHEITDTIQKCGGKPVAVEVRRGDETLHLEVAPQFDDLLGYYLLGIVFGAPDDPPTLTRMGKPSAAIEAGIPDGSRIVSINGVETKTWRRFVEQFGSFEPKPIEVGYRPPDSDETRTVKVAPHMVAPDLPLTGAEFQKFRTERLTSISNPLTALGYGLTRIKRAIALQVVSIKAMFGGRVATDQLSGPVRIGHGFYKMAEAGWGQFFSFLALISVIIGLLNAMPIPPLDGGHVMFLVVEKLIRKPVPLKVRTAVTIVGAGCLLLLVAVAFFNDGRWVFSQLFY